MYVSMADRLRRDDRPRRLSNVEFTGGASGQMQARMHAGTHNFHQFNLGLGADKKAAPGGAGNIRKLVSKKKRRFQEDGFDLDLTYITDQVIAMGFPSDWSDMEALYRNPVDEVVRMLATRHQDKFMVVNLCSERTYKSEVFEREGGIVLHLGFDDHNPPPLPLMQTFCNSVGAFLRADVRSDPKQPLLPSAFCLLSLLVIDGPFVTDCLCVQPDHVAAIHCKAGKGRTGTMIACLLLHMQEFGTADDALRWFGCEILTFLKWCPTCISRVPLVPHVLR